MTEPEVFILADRALEAVVARIRDEHWDLKMPPDFILNSRAGDPTLRELINYHAYDDAWVPDMLAGRTMEQAGAAKFDGDLLGDDPAASFSAIVDTACAAAEGFSDLDRVVHCSFGDFPARHYFWQINQFRALRAHDIARLIGVDAALPDVLVREIWNELAPNVEEWRAIGVFPAAVPVPADASPLDRLLGATGRQPVTTT